jgi:hypothetical protein
MVRQDMAAVRQEAPIGNRLALIGAVVYLLEWVAIIAASPPGPLGPGTGTKEVVAAYSHHAGAAAVSAGWFAVCLLGRVVYMAGLKASLRARPRELPLMDVAVAAMAISVTLEVAAYAVVAGAARLAVGGADSGLVVALDGAAFWLDLLIFGPAGVSLLAAGAAMLRSRLFPRWLGWIALLAGGAGTIGCVLSAATAGKSAAGLADALGSVAAIGMWVWMLVTGVLLWRAAPLPADHEGVTHRPS